jgi:hypothetical protein
MRDFPKRIGPVFRSGAVCFEHDPEKWKPVFRKIMLQQKDAALQN